MKYALVEMKRAAVAIVVLSLLLGILYPLVVWGIAQLLFPARANGSLLTVEAGRIGSEWIAQPFALPAYFHPRPSAAGYGIGIAVSGGSNLGPMSKSLWEQVDGRIREYREQNGLAATDPIPVDAVTTSASGLDPHISLDNAILQAGRVASVRRLSKEEVLRVIRRCREGRQLGILGEKRVNVLLLNLELDKLR